MSIEFEDYRVQVKEALEEDEVRVERIVKLLEECGSDNTEEVVTKALETICCH